MTATSHVLILIVDDEPIIRLLACDSLEEAGFDVIDAANAAEALDILAERTDVGVLFTDVNMPGGVNGLDLAETVHRRWPAIKLVVTSGQPPERPVADGGRFIAKPYNLRSMTDLVAEVSAGSACDT